MIRNTTITLQTNRRHREEDPQNNIHEKMLFLANTFFYYT